MVLTRKYKRLVYLEKNGWEMKSADCWVKNFKGKTLENAFEYEYNLNNPIESQDKTP